MNFFKKTYFFIMPLLTFIFFLILHYVFEIEQVFIKGAVSAGLAVVLSPRVRTIDTQNGTEEQIVWLFFSKAIRNKV